MPKFFIDKTEILDDVLRLVGTKAHHISHVLRLCNGEEIVATDGHGTDYFAVISGVEKEVVYANIYGKCKSSGESRADITVFQALPKGDKMDTVVQKSVELGAKKIVPIITSRTIANFKDKSVMANKVNRWNRLAVAAAEQCGRGILPSVECPKEYVRVLADVNSYDLAVVFHEKEKAKYLSHDLFGKSIKSICIIIGPEGGLIDDEVLGAVNKGAIAASLGPRILRTETAATVALAVIMHELGEI